MTEPIQDPTHTDARPRPRRARALTWLAGGVCLVLVSVVLIRVFIRPIPPGQVTPPGHFGDPCALCHIVTPNAEPVELP